MNMHLPSEPGAEIDSQLERSLRPHADHVINAAVTRYLAGIDVELTAEQGKRLLEAAIQSHRYDDEPEDLAEQFRRTMPSG